MSEAPVTPNAASATSYDPGLTTKYTGTVSRFINQDGQFNVRRTGRTWRDRNPYTFLINISWPTFSLIVIVTFIALNIAFAALYMAVGIDHIKGAEAKRVSIEFVNVFFFSTHTLTTVGYGNMYPEGPAANAMAAFEALVGLMGFAIATGLLFGRFSKPSARFGFSSKMVLAPFRGATSLQFRVVNRRTNNLIDVQAQVLLMTVNMVDGKEQRRYDQLDLERTQVLFFPLTWTVVHPIDEKSPLYGKTAEDLARLQSEVMIMIRGFDDVFGQTVNSRYSYRYDEIEWGAKFAAAFITDELGNLVLEVDKVGLTETAALPLAIEEHA